MKKFFCILFFAMFVFLDANSREYNILDFGAMKNALSTSAIQDAIDACHQEGGGMVIIPQGVFVTGTLVLKSNINLHLVQGAEIRSSLDVEDFRQYPEGNGMIFCQDATDVSITGEGVINAMGSSFYEADKNHKVSSALVGVKEYDKRYIRQKEGYLPEGVFFTDGPIKRKPRPGMTIVFFHCTNVTMRDVTVKDTPVWAIRFGYCENVLVDGISILNNLMIPNSDGIHCTVSRNVRINNCEIQAGDDAIIVTGFAKIEDIPGFNSKEQDTYTHGNKSKYAENIQVSSCHLQSRSSAIRVGYGQHPIRRCIFSNIIISDSNRGIGIFARDSASIEELIFSDIIIETRLHNGIWWGNGEPIHISAISRFAGEPSGQIRDVQFNNVKAIGGHGILLYGSEKGQLENIKFNNVSLHVKSGKETEAYGGNFDLRPTAFVEKQIFEHDIPGLYAQHVDRLSIDGFDVTWGRGLPDYFTHGIEAYDLRDLYIHRYSGSNNPNAPGSQKLMMKNCSTIDFD